MRDLKKYIAQYRKQSLWDKIYLSDWFDSFHKLYRNFIHFIETIKRMIFWGWKMRHNYDFDGQYIYEMLYLKLERIQKCMSENGHLVWNSSPDTNLMRKLAEAKGLAKKLSQFGYNENVNRFHETYKREKDDNYISLLFGNLYPDAKEIPANVYRHFMLKAHERDKLEQSFDKKRLYFLMDKYVEHWWD